MAVNPARRGGTGGTGRPTYVPPTPYKSGEAPLYVEDGWIWAPLRGDWLVAKPEERVRQEFIYTLHTEYGYALNQMAQERRTQAGRRSPKADIIVCKDAEALDENRDYVIVVECKAENVTIHPSDYSQGESYARAVGCEFLVMHNSRETRFFRLVVGAPGQRIDIETIPRREDLANERRLQAIRRTSKVFTRDEFRRLLKECHDILRDNHKLEPGKAFDEISKILFIKMSIERRGRHERFTEEYIRQAARYRRHGHLEEVMQDLFEDTKTDYRADKLFEPGEQVNISYETFRRIVNKLERFNLSATGEDVKGIAFEKFLGDTFRGDLGQFFTPRPLVDFMVEMLDPREGEVVCDPASGSGGFLIKTFEHVRAQIEEDVEGQKEQARRDLEHEARLHGWDEDEESERVDAALAELNKQLEVQEPGTRLHKAAHECIFGTDAEVRAARTSKMNMIMHGDGHGGIHTHDGLLDVNGVFPGRFDVVITNPPFGSSVGRDQRVGDTEATRVTDDQDQIRAYAQRFGDPYRLSLARMQAAQRDRDPILKLYEIGLDPIAGPPSGSRVRPSRDTEMLFLERCIKLLRPGGRMGIVLPDGILNNPSNQWLRDYCEGRARLLAVVSIPQDVFASAEATVKPSLVFLQRFTEQDEQQWAAAQAQALSELHPGFEQRRAAVQAEYGPRIASFDREDIAAAQADVVELQEANPPDPKAIQQAARLVRAMITVEDRERRQALQRERDQTIRAIDVEEQKALRARAKELFDYPVFMAEVEAAGITSSGETGPHVPNELPQVLDAYRVFRRDPAAFATAAQAVAESEAESAEVAGSVAVISSAAETAESPVR